MSPEPCSICGAAMAADQRYCLECGSRRGEPRLDYRVYLDDPPAPAPQRDRRSSWSLATGLATIACLLLAMGIGVLIGRSGDDGGGHQAAAPPQVIRVNASAPAATTATTPAASTTEATAPDAGQAKKAPAAKKKATSSKATSDAVKSLDSASPDDYQKQSEKLPKELGTGGQAPPKDDKPAAGGGDFETIG